MAARARRTSRRRTSRRSSRKKRSSRKPMQVGRWTATAKRARNIHSGLKRRRGSSARKGSLSFKGLQAREVKERDPQLKGRIAVSRGTGVVEFPDVEQFERIARQEKVPKEMVDKAFGHLKPKKPKRKRKTSRTRRKRTSRKSGSTLARILGLTPNAKKKSIRRDNVFVPAMRNGDTGMPLSARTVLIPEAEVPRFGSHRAVYMDIGGKVIVEPYERAIQLAQPWMTKKEFHKAFGHLRPKGVLGETPRRRIPTSYGPRSMKLGHRMPPAEGPALPGITRGQLVLYHKPTGSIVWQAYDDEVNFPDKPIWIWFGGKKAHFDIPKALEGAKVGKGDRAEFVGIIDRGIPPMAFLQAFDHLLTREQKAEAYQLFAMKR